MSVNSPRTPGAGMDATRLRRPRPEASPTPSIKIRPATAEDRDAIYSLRHDVYAVELRQHPVNEQRRLTDALDEHNSYFVAEADGRLIGFVSITPPSAPRYSVDKYLPREKVPLRFDDRLYEVRILTVAREHRRGPTAALLMQAVMHSVRKSGGTTIIVMGRHEVAGMYQKVGLKPLGISFPSGAVTYDLMAASVDEIEAAAQSWAAILARVRPAQRRLNATPSPTAGHQSSACDHGGAFFAAIGDTFDTISRRHQVINADVLDAWFPPAPGAAAALREHMEWALSTSPPTHANGLTRVISETRGVAPESIVVGGGSSSLIFLALRRWLTPASRVLILDPMYAEYEHVLSRIIGCKVDRFTLDPAENFRVDTPQLRQALARGYDFVVLVNPNNPTGQHIPRAVLEPILRDTPARTRIWVDEAYADYTGPEQSLERFAAASGNVVVCKSLSKAYALSGARAAYLVGPASIAADLRALTPPWAVSLPAQIAAIAALRDPAHYAACYAETHALRAAFVRELQALAPWRIIEGVINSVLCLLTESMPLAADVVHACREKGLFIRECSTISPSIGARAVRISIKDPATNAKMLTILRDALRV